MRTHYGRCLMAVLCLTLAGCAGPHTCLLGDGVGVNAWSSPVPTGGCGQVTGVVLPNAHRWVQARRFGESR